MSSSLHTSIDDSYSYANPVSEGRSSEWWEHWLFLLPIMVWISCVAQFMWPAFPDSFPLVVVWTLLTGAYLWFVSWTFMRRRKSSENWEVTYNPDGTTGMRTRYKPLESLLSTASITFFVGSLNLLLILFLRVGDPEISNAPAATFLACLCITLFVFIWPSRVGAFERRFARRGSGLLLIVSLILVIFGMSVAIPRLAAGSPAPWSKVLALAQHEAEKVDSNVYLDGISAGRYYYIFVPSESQYPSAVTFSFISREQAITVQVVDTDPPRLSGVRVVKGDPAAFDQSKPDMQVRKDRLAKITVGPRDVYQKTEGEGRAFALKYGADPSSLIVNVDLSFDPHPYGNLGVDTFWAISYLAETPTGLKTLDIRVDAATGKILGRGEY